MFIPKQDRLRHEILGLLLSEVKKSPKQQHLANEIALSTEFIANKLGTTTDEIKKAASVLIMNDEVKFDNFGLGEVVYAWNNSYAVYSQKKYLKDGRTFTLNRIKDYLGITVGLIAIVSAIYTAIKSIALENRNRQNIEKLQKELDTIKASIQVQTLPKKYPASH